MTNITIEDVVDIEYPGTPKWSPNSKFIAAAVSESNGDALLFASPDGDDKWRYRPPDDGGVATFEWHPSRTTCLVVSECGSVELVDPETKQARPVAQSCGREYTFSNTGQQIAYYTSGVPCVRNLQSSATITFDVPDCGPYRSDYRMLAWSPRDERLAFRFVDRDTKQIGVVDVSSRELLWRSNDDAAVRSPLWVDNERLLVERISDHAKHRQLIMIDLTTKSTETVFSESDVDAGVFLRSEVMLSPDRSRVTLTLPLDGWLHCYVLDLENQKLQQVTDGPFEDSGLVDSAPQWLDEKTIVFSSNRNGPETRAIFYSDTGSGEVTPLVTSAGTNVYPRVSPAGNHIGYVHADRNCSPELRVKQINACDPTKEPATSITQSPVPNWPIDPIDPDRIVLEADDGVEVPAFLIDPRKGPQSCKKRNSSNGDELPAVVWVHGGPMRQMRQGWHPSRAYGIAYAFHQFLAAKGYVGLLVNYRGSIGYGRQFRKAIAEDLGREVDYDLTAAAEYLSSLQYVDGDAITVWGLSYGGYATLRILGTNPSAFALGINIAGIADRRVYADWATKSKRSEPEFRLPTLFGGNQWEAPETWKDLSPVTDMSAYESPLYSFHGSADDDVHVEQLDIVAETLLDENVQFEAEYYPGESHVFQSRTVWYRTLQKIYESLESKI